jgi:hypothetical protein
MTAEEPKDSFEEIDRACDRFEAEWRSGAEPQIEMYIAAASERARPGLACELLKLDIHYRRDRGDTILPSDYKSRFPDHASLIDTLLSPQKPIGRPMVAQAPEPTPAAALSTANQSAEPSAPDTAPQGPGPGPALERVGRYQIIRRLGRGGMGTVYLAHDPQLDRRVALKIPHFTAEDDPQMLERFYREARIAATLRHPNLCPVYDVGESCGFPYLTMAYIEGQPLSVRLQAGPSLSPPQAAALVIQLARALEVAHQKGIIHRDLKPANVLLGPDGEPVVTDFGLARRSDKGDARLTRSGALLGTPAYMSPEQVGPDPAAVGPASDVYSLGVMLYEMLTGKLPFTGTIAEILHQIQYQESPRPSALRPDLDAQLEGIVIRAMAKKLEARYRTMGEFAGALDDYLRQEESRTRPVNRLTSDATWPTTVGPPVPPKRKARNLRRWWWGVSVGVVWRWRKAFGVSRMDNEGSARLMRAAAEMGGEAVAAREWTEEEREGRRQTNARLGLAKHLVTGYHGPLWAAGEIALLGTVPDREVARRTGRSVDGVRRKRMKLGIANRYDRRRTNAARRAGKDHC